MPGLVHRYKKKWRFKPPFFTYERDKKINPDFLASDFDASDFQTT